MVNKYWRHFKTITKHKIVVMLLCFKCGFYKRGLLHDLSKYSRTEFVTSARYFQGTKSPIDAEKQDIGYSFAWQHHKEHNPHHWEYWIDTAWNRANDPIRIPYEYVVEMVCDWVGAGIVYSHKRPDFDKPYSEPMKYYIKCRSERIFHKDTEKLLEYFLNLIERDGINVFCNAVKHCSGVEIWDYLYIP